MTITDKRNAIVVGGTGFLGFHAITALLDRGWNVTALALPPAPPENLFPHHVKLILHNFEQVDDGELVALLRGQQALVFAAGLDDRYTPARPAYPIFHHANVDAPKRLFNLAKQAGIRRAVVLGSYFAYFDRLWPEMRLSERHAYIRSRVEQEAVLTSIPGIETCILELPYIFGALPIPGWRPLWQPLVRYARSLPLILYMHGGSACIAAQTAGRAIAAAVEYGKAGERYPIGQENFTWKELLARLAGPARNKRVIALPTWMIQIGLWGLWLFHYVRGRESGLDPRTFAPLQTARAFIDPLPAQLALNYKPGDLDEAIRATLGSSH
jgi:dihydroflavonol-4-reductase